MKRIYLDYNSTSLINKSVADLMIEMLQSPIAYNPSSIHGDGRKARAILETARLKVAKSLGINLQQDGLQITFTSSGTEANNIAVNHYSKIPILVGATEHVSILDAGDAKNDKILIAVEKNGIIKLDDFVSKLESLPQGPKFISIMLANNETGVIQNIKELVKIAHQYQGIFHCDASQAFSKIAFNITDLDCDLVTISSHKAGGPVGAAALIHKTKLNLHGQTKGGKQEQGIRAGTENLIAIAGFAEAASKTNETIFLYQQIMNLRNQMEEKILEFCPTAEIIAKDCHRLPNTSLIRMPNVLSEEQLIKFDLAGISLSSGSACSSGRIASSHVLSEMNVDRDVAAEVVRVSMGPTTSIEEIDSFIKLWEEIYMSKINKKIAAYG